MFYHSFYTSLQVFLKNNAQGSSCCIISLRQIYMKEMPLYVKLIIPWKYIDWKTLQIFFHIFFCVLSTNGRSSLPFSTFHANTRNRWFDPLPLQAFPVEDYGKVAQCFLLCLFPCKGWLYAVYGYHCCVGAANYSAETWYTACIPLHWWYHDRKVWYKIWGRFKTVRPCPPLWSGGWCLRSAARGTSSSSAIAGTQNRTSSVLRRNSRIWTSSATQGMTLYGMISHQRPQEGVADLPNMG